MRGRFFSRRSFFEKLTRAGSGLVRPPAADAGSQSGTANQSLQPDHHILGDIAEPFADGFSGKYDSAVADSCNEVTRSANSLTEGVGQIGSTLPP